MAACCTCKVPLCARRCGRVTARIAWSENIPFLNDFYEDRVSSRSLTVLIFVVVILYVARVGIFPLFLLHPLVPPVAPATVLTHVPLTRGSTEVGATVFPFLALKYYLPDTGSGVYNASVAVALAPDLYDVNVWQARYGLRDTVVDYQGLPVDGRFSLPGFVPRVLLSPVLSGSTGTTDIGGVARLWGLRMELGLPGRYAVVGTSPNGTATISGLKLEFASQVTRIVIVSAPVSRQNTTLAFGASLPPIVVRVTDIRGTPLAGKRVALISAPPSTVEFSSFISRADLLLPRYALFDPTAAVSAPTDYLGYATLYNASVLASMSATVRAVVVCDGIISDTTIEFKVAQRPPFNASAAAASAATAAASAATAAASGFVPSPSASASVAPVVTPTTYVTLLPGAPAACGNVTQAAALATTAGSIVLTLVRAPDARVMEGKTFTQQPQVQVAWRTNVTYTPPAGGAVVLCPVQAAVPGARVLAVVKQEAGLLTQTLITPAFTRELNVVGASATAVLSNVGQRKHVFNFTSLPSGVDGIATWENSGFIRHGPAGNYTLAFTYAGMFAGIETPPIVVNSSVAAVAASLRTSAVAALAKAFAGEYPPALLPGQSCDTVVVCASCTYDVGGSYGSLGFQGSAGRIPIANMSAYRLPAGPSGYFPCPPAATITASDGTVVAGKAATLVVSRLNATTGVLTPASDIRVGEFPYVGATTSILSLASSTAEASEDGALVYMAHNVGLGDSAQQLLGTYRGTFGSFQRVLTAPAGTTTGLVWQLDVEGVRTPPQTFKIVNQDPTTPGAAGVCSYIDITATPDYIRQTSASLVYRNTPMPSNVVATAYNSFGSPIQGLNVSLYPADVFGVFIGTAAPDVVQAGVDTPLFNIRQDHITYLRQFGGAGAFAMGSYIAGLYSLTLPSAVDTGVTGAQGTAQFRNSGIVMASNTYLRFAAVAVQNTFNDLAYQGCVSMYSAPIPVMSEATAVGWTNQPAFTDNITCIADGATAISPRPQPAITINGSAPGLYDNVAAVLLTVVDNELTQYPGYIALASRRFDLNVATNALGQPQVQRGVGDVPTSAVMPVINASTVEYMLYAVSSPFLDTIYGGMAVAFKVLDPDTGVYQYPLQAQSVAVGFDPATGRPVVPSMVAPRGATGDFRFVTVAQGVISEPWTTMRCSDTVNALLTVDYQQGGCPSNQTSLVVVGGRAVPVRRDIPPNSCPGNCGGPGRGQCVCGICICRPGWDGDLGCNTAYDGDSYNLLFAQDPQYIMQYGGGLPVVNGRMGLEFFDSQMEPMQRFILARAVVAGRLNLTNLYSYAATLLQALPSTTLAPAAQRLGDAVTAALLTNVSLVQQLQWQQAGGAPYTVMPVLTDCAGNEVSNYYLTPSTPLEDRCAQQNYPIFSDPVAINAQGTTNGVSTFDSFLYTAIYNNVPAALNPARATRADILLTFDRRLFLWGVPTGCYRFKYVYAPTSSGNLKRRTLASPIGTAQAVSLGASRPFRYLAPVNGLSVASTPSYQLVAVRDVPLNVSIAITVDVRIANDNRTRPLTDYCQVGLATDPVSATVTTIGARCPREPYGGVPVYVSAISTSTAREFPLYITGQTVDCARSVVGRAANGNPTYLATFTSITFPTYPDLTPEVPSLSYVISPGTYKLRFRSYGTVFDSGIYVNVVEQPSRLTPVSSDIAAASNPVSYYSGIPVFSGTVGSAVGTGIAAATFIDSSVISGANTTVTSTAMGRIVVTAEMAGGPVNSNAVLDATSTVAVSDTDGVAHFSGLRLTQGKSGVYAFRLSATGVTCNASLHIAYVNFTNPIQAVTVTQNGDLMLNTWDSPIIFSAGSALTATYRVCALNASGLAGFPRETVTARIYADPQPATNASQWQVMADAGLFSAPMPGVWGSSSDQCASSPGEDRVPVTMSFTVTTAATGDDGCLTLSELAFVGISQSQRVQVVFSARGVEAPPVHFSLLSARDAQPVSLEDLKNRIPIPMALSLAPFAVNVATHGHHSKMIFLMVGIACLALLWYTGAQPFVDQAKALSRFYEQQDISYIDGLNAMYMVALAAATLMTITLMAWFIVHQIGKRVRDCCCPGAARDRLRSGTGAPHLLGSQRVATASFSRQKETMMRIYCANVRPSLVHALRTPDGKLHPAFVEALAHVYERYAGSSGAAGAGFCLPEWRCVLNPSSLWQYTLSVAFEYGGLMLTRSAPLPRMTREGLARCRTDILAAHLHLDPAFLSKHSEDTVTVEQFVTVIRLRLEEEGAAALQRDLHALNACTDVDVSRLHAVVPVQQPALRRRTSTFTAAAPPATRRFTLSAEGERIAARAFNEVRAVHNERGYALTLSNLAIALDESLRALGSYVLRADSPPSLIGFLQAYSERLQQATHNFLTNDTGIWRELRHFGFRSDLSLSLVHEQGRSLLPEARTALAKIFATVGRDGKTSWLSHAEVSRLRALVRRPPVRRDFFMQSAVHRTDEAEAASPGGPLAAGSLRVVVNPIATASRSPPETGTADADGTTDDPLAHHYVNPDLYFALCTLLYEDPSEHLRELLAAFGYSPRLWYSPQASDMQAAGREGATRSIKRTASTALVEAFDASQASGGRLLTGLCQCRSANAAATDAVFYPQRLLVALATSLVVIALVTMLLAHYSGLLQAYLAAFTTTATQDMLRLAAASAQQQAVSIDTTSIQMQSAVAWAAVSTSDTYTAVQTVATSQVAQDVLSGKTTALSAEEAVVSVNNDPSSAVQIAVAAALGQIAGQTSSQNLLPPALQSALATGSAAATLATSQSTGIGSSDLQLQLQANAYSFLTGMGAQAVQDDLTILADMVPVATGIALGASALAIMAAYWHFFYIYRQYVLQCRRGAHPIVWDANTISPASKYIGTQVAHTTFSFILLAAVLWLVIMVLSIPEVSRWLKDSGVNLVLSLVGTALLIQISEWMLVAYVLTWRTRIRFRRLLALADVWYSFTSLFVGSIAALIRIALTIPFALAGLMRVDISPLPKAIQNYDPSTSCFNAVLLLDAQLNHPIKWVFCEALIAGMKERRQRAQLTSSDASKRTLSPTAVTSKIRKAVATAATNAFADASTESAFMLRRLRCRNRWQLALLLSRNPSLRQYRVRDGLIMPLAAAAAFAAIAEEAEAEEAAEVAAAGSAGLPSPPLTATATLPTTTPPMTSGDVELVSLARGGPTAGAAHSSRVGFYPSSSA